MQRKTLVVLPTMTTTPSRTTAIGRPLSTPRPTRPFWFAPAGCEILREIGRGGMSTVYEACCYQTVPGRVALKVSIPNATATQLERFESEARIGGLLTHPAIPRTFAYGRFDGGMWMTMEIIDGVALSRVIDSSTLGTAARLQILIELAGAVDHVHSHGVIHRDIKPGNVLLADDGPKLVDFGIAKTPSASLTHPRYVVGTPDYLAPEQVAGKDVDHRVDVFQLGLLAFQLFATRLPWTGRNMLEIGWALCFEKPARLKDWLRPGTRMSLETLRELESIIDRTLARNRNHRFDSAGAFGAAVSHLLEGFRNGG